MEDKKFKTYLEKFETEVVIHGIESGKFGKEMMIPIRQGKLDNTDFGKKLGTVFICTTPAAIDYYGFIKKSSGFVSKLDASNSEMQIKAIRAPMVHFASIKIEYVSDLSSDLVEGFPDFKKSLVQLRGFKAKRKMINGDSIKKETV